MPEQEYMPTEADREDAKSFLIGLSLDGTDETPQSLPAEGVDDIVAELAALFAKVRADERAKRPDREQIAKALFEVRDDPYDDDRWEDLDSQQRERWECDADAVLALEPEAREEHRPVDIEPSDTVCAGCSRRQGDGTYTETVEWPCALAEAREEAELFHDQDGDLWKLTDKGEWFHEEDPGEFRQVLSIDAEDQTLTPVGHAELAPDAEARETEVAEFNDGPAFRSKGMVHTLTVAPTSGGWLVTCQDFHGESSCNLPSGDAIKLAQMLHPEACEVTDERAEAAARRMFIYDTATAGDSEGAWDTMDEKTILRKMYLTRARAVLVAAREVSRG